MAYLEYEIEQVMSLKDNEDLTFEEIGKKFGFSRSWASRRYKAGLLERAAKEYAKEVMEEKEDNLPIPKPLNIKAGKYLPNNLPEITRFRPVEVYASDVIVTSDYHIPLYDAELVNAMLNSAREKKIKKLIIGGDLFHMESFSHFLPHQPEAEFSIEKYEGNLFIKTALNVFDEIIICWGNHDHRIAKFLEFKHSFVDCMKWVLSDLSDSEMSRVTFSDLDYLYLYTDDRKYRICHPKEFSSVPLTVPRELAMKYGCSVISAHSHHAAIGVAKDGYNLIMEAAGFFSKNHTEYIQRTTKNHEWVQGWIEFVSSVPTLYSPTLGNTQQYMVKEVK